jgi:hypothetical protein
VSREELAGVVAVVRVVRDRQEGHAGLLWALLALGAVALLAGDDEVVAVGVDVVEGSGAGALGGLPVHDDRAVAAPVSVTFSDGKEHVGVAEELAVLALPLDLLLEADVEQLVGVEDELPAVGSRDGVTGALAEEPGALRCFDEDEGAFAGELGSDDLREEAVGVVLGGPAGAADDEAERLVGLAGVGEAAELQGAGVGVGGVVDAEPGHYAATSGCCWVPGTTTVSRTVGVT